LLSKSEPMQMLDYPQKKLWYILPANLLSMNPYCLGAQCIGPRNVSKQVAQWAMAIQGGISVDQVINFDLPYAPPFPQAIDHFITSAHILQNKMKGRLKGVSAKEVR